MEVVTISIGRDQEMLVDASDVDFVLALFPRAFKCSGRWYAVGRKDKKQILIHRAILNAPKGLSVDHVNGNGLDNRRCNIRLCTHAQNMANSRHQAGSSGYRGVKKTKRKSGAWQAGIQVNYREIHLGVFSDKIEAARAYDTAAKQFFGPFARLNFPEHQDHLSNGSFFKPLETTECGPIKTDLGKSGAEI